MKIRTVILVLTAFLAVTMNAYNASKLSTDLLEVFHQEAFENERLSVILIMEEQYDPDRLYSQVNHLARNKRRQQTIETLKSFSKDTQREVRTLLSRLENNNQVRKSRYLWISNVIGVRATRDAISILSNHPDISAIHYDPMTPALNGLLNDSNSASSERMSRRNVQRDQGSYYRNVTENVELINAPEVWELDITGEGTIVAVLDTGVNYNHHDLRNRMWEHPEFPNHGYNFVNHNLDTMDNNRHGTHCAGTVAGDGSAGRRTGVAPGSVIMSLKVLDDDGSGEHQMLWEAMQFAVEYGADIMSVSLGWTNVHNTIRAIFRDISTNVLSGGVIMVKSAGNRGNAGITVPGDCPSPVLMPDQTLRGGVSAVFTVGATNYDDEIANFSSRGPVTWQDVPGYEDYPLDPEMGLIKPDITAPGVDVISLSHSNVTGYRDLSGTSMATPATAGVAALMLSRNPHLTPEDIARIIEQSAVPLSETKSNTYGSGRVDAFEAVDQSVCITLTDFAFSDGDNDIPEYGDVIDISITLYNFQVEEAHDMIGTLTSDDEYIDILDGREELGDLEVDSTAAYTDAFSVRIADNVPDGHTASFTVNISVDEDREWNRRFDMKINAPVLFAEPAIVHDPLPGGNNNGFIDPDEALSVFLPLTNSGSAESEQVSFSVTSHSDLAAITSVSDSLFTSIRVDETYYPKINMQISNDADDGDMLPFSYRIETGEYLFAGEFDLVVGSFVPARIGRGEDVNHPEEASPINTFFRSCRSQTVYTKEELNKAGIFDSFSIDRLGYYIVEASEHALTDFIIRIKHTEAADASEHLDGPYETFYQTASYNPQEGYWDMLTSDNPFEWNGRDNILIDTAFSPVAGFSAAGQIRVFDAENGFRYTRFDHPDQTNEETTSISSDKPQIMMLFDAGDGIDNRPQNLAAQLRDTGVLLEWDAPGDNRSTNSPDRRRLAVRSELGSPSRNPDGYNVYKNGNLLNDDLITENHYLAETIDMTRKNYFFVTAIYDDYESRPSNIVDVELRVPDPEFSPSEKIQYDAFLLTITCDLDNAEIYYRLDGDEPTTDDHLYEEPFLIEYRTTVSAKAFKDGWLDSETATQEYHVHYPVEDLEGKPLVNAVKLKWQPPWSPEERMINLNNPNTRLRRSSESSRRSMMQQSRYHKGYNIYRSDAADSFIVINDTPIENEQFIDENLPAGELAYYVTSVYDMGESMPSDIVRLNGIVEKPHFSHEPGDYEQEIYLKIKTSTPYAVIYYTKDGTMPTDSSSVFSDDKPLKINQPTTVKAFAAKKGWQDSEIAKGDFFVLSTDEKAPDLPVTELLNAYPNPFNPETYILFTLAEPDHVTINIYNIKGQKVQTVVNDFLAKGKHRFAWQGDDKHSRNLSSGVYLYQMITSEYNKTKKVLMLK